MKRQMRPLAACAAAPRTSGFKGAPADTASMPGVLLLDQPEYLLRVGRLTEPLAERRILHQARDARERLQVKARRVLGCDQQEEQESGGAVEGIEINPAPMASENSNDVVHARDFAMRNRYPVAYRS